MRRSPWLFISVVLLLLFVGLGTTTYNKWTATHLSGTYNTSDALMTVVFHPDGTYDWHSVMGDQQGQYEVEGDNVDMMKQAEAQMPKIGADTSPGDRGTAMFGNMLLDAGGLHTGTLSPDRRTLQWASATFSRQ